MNKREFKFFVALMVFGLMVVFLPILSDHSANATNGNWWLVAERAGNYDAIRSVCDVRTGNLLYETEGKYVSMITVVPGGCALPKPPPPSEVMVSVPAPIPTPAPAPTTPR